MSKAEIEKAILTELLRELEHERDTHPDLVNEWWEGYDVAIDRVKIFMMRYQTEHNPSDCNSWNGYQGDDKPVCPDWPHKDERGRQL